jgi:hypothetical protein
MLTGPTHHKPTDGEKFNVEELHEVASSFLKEPTLSSAKTPTTSR